jgi:hypothetical protein
MNEPVEEDSKTRNLALKIEHFLSNKRLNTIAILVTLVLFVVIIYQQILMLARIQFLFWFIIIDILVIVALSLPLLEKHIQRALKK